MGKVVDIMGLKSGWDFNSMGMDQRLFKVGDKCDQTFRGKMGVLCQRDI